MTILFLLIIIAVIVLISAALYPELLFGHKDKSLKDEVLSLRADLDRTRRDQQALKEEVNGIMLKIKNFENKVMVTVNLLKESNRTKDDIALLDEAYKRISDEVDLLKSCLKSSADKDFFKDKVSRPVSARIDITKADIPKVSVLPLVDPQAADRAEDTQEGLKKLLEQIKGLSRRSEFDPGLKQKE